MTSEAGSFAGGNLASPEVTHEPEAAKLLNQSSSNTGQQVARIFSVYGLDDTPATKGGMLHIEDDSPSKKSSPPEHNMALRKPLHGGVRLEAMNHEFSKQKIHDLLHQQSKEECRPAVLTVGNSPCTRKRLSQHTQLTAVNSNDVQKFPKSKPNFTAAEVENQTAAETTKPFTAWEDVAMSSGDKWCYLSQPIQEGDAITPKRQDSIPCAHAPSFAMSSGGETTVMEMRGVFHMQGSQQQQQHHQQILIARDHSLSRSIDARNGEEHADHIAYQASTVKKEGRLTNSMSMKQRSMLAPSVSSGQPSRKRHLLRGEDSHLLKNSLAIAHQARTVKFNAISGAAAPHSKNLVGQKTKLVKPKNVMQQRQAIIHNEFEINPDSKSWAPPKQSQSHMNQHQGSIFAPSRMSQKPAADSALNERARPLSKNSNRMHNTRTNFQPVRKQLQMIKGQPQKNSADTTKSMSNKAKKRASTLIFDEQASKNCANTIGAGISASRQLQQRKRIVLRAVTRELNTQGLDELPHELPGCQSVEKNEIMAFSSAKVKSCNQAATGGTNTENKKAPASEDQTSVLQDWASHVRYPRRLQQNRPVVDTGLFKSMAQLMYEKWIRLALPLHQIETQKRLFLMRMAKVRITAAKRLRDRWLLQWVKRRKEVYAEVRRLEQIAKEEEEKRRLAELERQRQQEEDERHRKAEAEERARLKALEEARLQRELEERERLRAEQLEAMERQNREMLLDRLRRQEVSMELLHKWVQGKQRVARIWGKHAYYMKRLLRIQRAVRKFLIRGKAKARLQKTYNIQRLLKGILVRKQVQSKLKAIPVLQRILPMFVARYRFRRFRRCVTKLQALFRMRKQRKLYLAQKQQKSQMAKLSVMEQRKRWLLNRKKWKQSVLIIEKYRYAQLHRRECRMLRKYLARLPYECRGLYFKFVDVKKNTHFLVNSFVNYMETFHNVSADDGFDLRYT